LFGEPDRAGADQLPAIVPLELAQALSRPDAPQSKPDGPRQPQSYRLTNVIRGIGGEMTGDVEYGDGRVKAPRDMLRRHGLL
jgi:hypothetical protein